MMPTYTISPSDYNALRAMLTHEGAETIARDLKSGNTNSAYGQLIGLAETWLNRAASKGLETDGLQGLMAHPQVSFFPKDQAGIDREAGQLDPRIGQMLDTYLNSRNSGDAGTFGGVDHYLNPSVTENLYGLPSWYTSNKDNTVGKFGDYSKGGTSSKQQDFLDIPGSYNVPKYDVRVSNKIALNPTEGDVNALDDFRNSYTLPDRFTRVAVPLPPERPTDGSAGIAPPAEGRAYAGSLPDQFSDAITGGLQKAGGAVLGAFNDLTGRLPTADEFQARIDSLKSGATSIWDQIGDIAKSPEAKSFSQATGIDPSQYVINDAYQQLLGRGADTGGLGQNLSVLQNGGSLRDIANSIANSQEGQSYALNNFYGNAFGRGIDSGGLQSALDQLSRGTSLASLEGQLLQSPEAQARGITPDQFAGLLTPSYFSPTLGTGATSGTISPTGTTLTIGAGSPISGVTNLGLDTAQTIGSGPTTPTLAPGVNSVINDMYEAIVHRPADAAGGQAWSQALNSGAMDLNQIQAAMLGGDEAQTIGAPDAAQTYSLADTVYARGLGRTAEASIQPSIAQALTQGLTPEQFAQGVYASPEAAAYRGTLSPEIAALLQQPFTAKTFGGQGTASTLGAGPNTQTQGAGAAVHGFDPTEYLKANPDVARAGMDAVQHYEQYGFGENRAIDTQGDRLGQNFDGAAYLAKNQDVAMAGLNPLDHYIKYGRAEGRDYTTGASPYDFSSLLIGNGLGGQTQPLGAMSATHAFNPAEYLQANPDVARSGMDALTHYEQFGFGENRAIDTAGDRLSQNFDGGAYLAQNPDVAMAGFNPLDHFLKFGQNEGRAFTTGISPFDFSSFNVGGGLGAQPQSMSSAYGVVPSISNLGFSGLDPSAGLGGGNGSFGSTFGITPNSSGIGSPSASNMGTSGMGASGGIGLGQGIDAIGAPRMSVVGGYLPNIRSDGTTNGTKSLAQTNAEFNAITQKTLADARAGTERLNILANNLGPSSNIGATTTLSSFASPMRWL